MYTNVLDDPALKEKIIQILNQARCIEKEIVGNAELAERIIVGLKQHLPMVEQSAATKLRDLDNYVQGCLL